MSRQPFPPRTATSSMARSESYLQTAFKFPPPMTMPAIHNTTTAFFNRRHAFTAPTSPFLRLVGAFLISSSMTPATQAESHTNDLGHSQTPTTS